MTSITSSVAKSTIPAQGKLWNGSKTPRRVGISRGPDRPLPDGSHFVIGLLCDVNHILRRKKAANPTRGVKLPKQARPRNVYLSEFIVGSLKSNENRTVVVPALVMTALAATATGKCREHLQWTAPHGGYLRPPGRESWLTGAVARCQAADETFPRVTAHALRHTAASLAISAGREPQGGAADARACQRGHDAGRVRRFVRV